MKLFRSDLEKHISNQLFEISADSLNLDDIQVAGDTLSCTLSSEYAPNGYRVHGLLSVIFIEKCDRCLAKIEEKHESSINIILTDNDELLDNKNIDVIHFSNSEEFIDLSPIIHDLILLEEPLKRLCNESCRGLCPNCGNDLNESQCSCAPKGEDSRWGQLKELK
ncbi:MAG: DUF177 domain-containing protein [Candidatus Marinimicrobia bacterium]|nr:DUF177 domain-containing protein [Candidatus Neomarinimicrobiota bacterium]MBL7030675.1 DUF177 domain-containing protein [Candidatus Neomarinimicrobiota bacterium]